MAIEAAKSVEMKKKTKGRNKPSKRTKKKKELVENAKKTFPELEEKNIAGKKRRIGEDAAAELPTSLKRFARKNWMWCWHTDKLDKFWQCLKILNCNFVSFFSPNNCFWTLTIYPTKKNWNQVPLIMQNTSAISAYATDFARTLKIMHAARSESNMMKCEQKRRKIRCSINLKMAIIRFVYYIFYFIIEFEFAPIWSKHIFHSFIEWEI